MDKVIFEKLRFSESTDVSLITPDIIKRFMSEKKHLRILELGCGTGKDLLKIARDINGAECYGVDISGVNIEIAKENAFAEGLHKKISFLHADYIDFTASPYDVIYAESVLHFISVGNIDLFNKIANDLKYDGILLATIPDDCLYNKVLIMFRRLMRTLRCSMLDNLFFILGRLIYPSKSKAAIRDRVHYMYILPTVINTAKLHRELKINYGLVMVSNTRCQSSSAAKLRHNLVVFKKTLKD